jgi:cellulose synthase (UDP-forming)
VRAHDDDAWPVAESRSSVRSTHVTAVAGLTLVASYLVWRAVATLTPLSLALGLALLALEAWSLVALTMQTRVLWDIDAVRPPAEVTTIDATVTVLIPTTDEPLEVLVPTLAAATRMRLTSEIIVLDGGHRRWLAGMCDELGIGYRAPVRDASPAAQINTVLPGLDCDFVVVLSADQVATSDFLEKTLAHFDDTTVALVQTARDHYNEDSFEHAASGRAALSDQTLFERVMGAGRNDLNAAFWTGGAAIIRRTALVAVGGVATDTTAEHLETTINMHEAGWRTIHHNEVLARGRGAADAAEFADRQRRLAVAAMQVLRSRRFLMGSALNHGQRLGYRSYLTDWLAGWRTLGYLVIPAMALLLALTPAAGPVALFVVLFPVTWALRHLTRRTMGRGRTPKGDVTALGIIRMTATLPAAATLATGRTGRGAQHSGDPRRVPALIWLLLAINASSILWAAAVLTGLVPVSYPFTVIAIAAMAWALVNVIVLTRATTRIRSRYFGGDRRKAQRIEVDGHAYLDGVRTHLMDLSLTGVRLLSYGEVPDWGTYCSVTFTDRNRRSAVVTGTVAGITQRPHGVEVRVALEADQTYVMGAILADALVRRS